MHEGIQIHDTIETTVVLPTFFAKFSPPNAIRYAMLCAEANPTRTFEEEDKRAGMSGNLCFIGVRLLMP